MTTPAAPAITIDDLADVLARLDIYRPGFSYDETANMILDELFPGGQQ